MEVLLEPYLGEIFVEVFFLGLVSVFLVSQDWFWSIGVFIWSVKESTEDGEHSGSSV